MSEQFSYDQLGQPDSIEIADLNELSKFEDVLAWAIEPDMSEAQLEVWHLRPHIRNFVRPKGVNGSIVNIHLEVMNEPYARLLDAKDRGWKLPSGGPRRLNAANSGQIPRYWGAKFRADAHSTSRGKVGEILTEMWYYPVPHKSSRAFEDQAITRVIAQPKFIGEGLAAADEASRRVWLARRRIDLSMPHSHPMRD